MCARGNKYGEKNLVFDLQYMYMYNICIICINLIKCTRTIEIFNITYAHLHSVNIRNCCNFAG